MPADDFMTVVELYDRAIKTRDNLEFAESVELFKQALRIMAHVETVLPFRIAFAYDMALARDLSGDSAGAKQLFELAVELYEEFRHSEPNHDAVNGFSGLMWGVNDYLSLVNNADMQADNYLDSITPRRWAAEKLPLKVYVDSSPATGFDTTLAETIFDAFHAWTQNQTFLRWEKTTSPDQAMITVTRVADGLDSAGGHTAFEETSDGNGNVQLQSANIRISMHSPDSSVYKPAELRAFKSLTIHEVGHALGVDGHSPHASDLMYWKSPLLELSDRDVRTLKLMYS